MMHGQKNVKLFTSSLLFPAEGEGFVSPSNRLQNHLIRGDNGPT